MCVRSKGQKNVFGPKTERWKKVQNWVADFHMLKSIRTFWRNEGWGIAIKKKWWSDSGMRSKFSILMMERRFSLKCTFFHWLLLTDFAWTLLTFFRVFDCIWSIVHNVKDFPKCFRFQWSVCAFEVRKGCSDRNWIMKKSTIAGSKSRGGDIIPNIFLALTPAGAESDLNASTNGA